MELTATKYLLQIRAFQWKDRDSLLYYAWHTDVMGYAAGHPAWSSFVPDNLKETCRSAAPDADAYSINCRGYQIPCPMGFDASAMLDVLQNVAKLYVLRVGHLYEEYRPPVRPWADTDCVKVADDWRMRLKDNPSGRVDEYVYLRGVPVPTGRVVRGSDLVVESV